MDPKERERLEKLLSIGMYANQPKKRLALARRLRKPMVVARDVGGHLDYQDWQDKYADSKPTRAQERRQRQIERSILKPNV